MPSPKYLTAAEVADVLRLTPITVVRLCREGKLPATKPAGTWLIAEPDLLAHIEASRPAQEAS
ncbi:MAG TPA: helix-turn-helix domain-containing protein [Acidimicrobiales bacterium]|nr:helix-turn-helix domain-containing protein [Acidimicrobiales bacterium]